MGALSDVFAALHEIQRLGYAGPWPCAVMVGPVIVDVRAPTRSRRLCIESLWVSPSVRGQGYASRMLRQITSVADRHGVACELRPRPYDGRPLKVGELRAWYARHGFELASDRRTMVRLPAQGARR